MHVSALRLVHVFACIVLTLNQGCIKLPKAARGHATSNTANIDSIVLNVTKNRGPCAACKTAHTIEVLISTSTHLLSVCKHLALLCYGR